MSGFVSLIAIGGGGGLRDFTRFSDVSRVISCCIVASIFASDPRVRFCKIKNIYKISFVLTVISFAAELCITYGKSSILNKKGIVVLQFIYSLTPQKIFAVISVHSSISLVTLSTIKLVVWEIRFKRQK